MNTLSPIYWPSIRWPLTLVRQWTKDLWASLPGPWYVKVLLIVITQAIPGPQDELLLLGIVALCRYIKRRKLN